MTSTGHVHSTDTYEDRSGVAEEDGIYIGWDGIKLIHESNYRRRRMVGFAHNILDEDRDRDMFVIRMSSWESVYWVQYIGDDILISTYRIQE